MGASVPQTMWASVMTGVGEVRLEERATPRPAADEVLIKVGSVGVCGSDVHYFHHGRIGNFIVDSPLILGHELGGTIVAVGSDVPASRVGQRVGVEPQRCCRVCEYCKSGRYNLCAKMEFYATPPIDGAFCEYVTIQSDFAHTVPDSMSDDAAAMLEPLSVGIASIKKARVRPGDSVLIAGGGPIGILIAQCAHAFGVTETIITEPSADRRKIAAKYATRVLDPRDPALQDVHVNAFIDASGAEPAILAGIDRVKPDGTVVLVGMGADTFPLPVGPVTSKELVVTGIFRYTETWPVGIDLWKAGRVELDALVTDVYGLDRVAEALGSVPGPTTLKRVVRPAQRDA